MGCNFTFVLCCILLVSCPSTILSTTSAMGRALLVEKKPEKAFHKNSGEGFTPYPVKPQPGPGDPPTHY